MQSTVHTACITGAEVIEVAVEIDLRPGLPTFTIIGLPDKQIDEAKERVRTAIQVSGFTFPLGHITVNLAPAAVQKRGTGFDLAIAVGILISAKVVSPLTEQVWFIGELGLNGEVRPVKFLPSLLRKAREKKVKVLIPKAQEEILRRVDGIFAYLPQSLKELGEVWPHFTWQESRAEGKSKKIQASYKIDTIRGQEQGKRALLISLAGRHPLLLSGPPGMGKTLLLEAARELLPELTTEEEWEVEELYSLADAPPGESVPFRNPPHTTSKAALIGGGVPLKPGEVSLAHRGVLFLDELPLFSRDALESLREVIGSKVVMHIRGENATNFRLSALLWRLVICVLVEERV